MKKLIILGLFLILAGTSFGQVNFSLGANAGYSLSTYTFKMTADWQVARTDYIVTSGLFVDLTYVQFVASYARSLGGTAEVKLGTASTSEPLSEGYYINYINLKLLGKYPFDFGNVKVWPTAGLMYSITISMDANADETADDLTDYDVNDLYFVSGCGIDAFLSDQFYFTFNVLYNLNLMPIPSKDITLSSDQAMSQWQISSEAGIGFRF